jgi:ABC-type oligopeptide transport system substrate-binding subunit/class 3 adenylate cyclase/tetratricopeptide (TPR) repeat protein
MREERRVVTALCADLVGSTRLTERLDPEDARLVVGEAVARIVHTVEGFGGTVKDLAGDGVLALFGAPTAHEDDPERALRAALQITDVLGSYGRDVERSFGIDGFGVRVGVNSGMAVVGPVGAGSRVEYGATGDVVNIAARLQAEAEPGSVLVGSETKRSAERLFRWGAERALALKGVSAEVLASVVEGALASPASRHDVRLFGRDAELAAAQAAIDAVLSGAGGVMFITGEAGIGKSRLVAELRDGADRNQGGRRLVWLEGRCVSYGETMPYWPFRELLGDWLGVSLDDPELRMRLALRRALEEATAEGAPEFYPYLGSLLGLTLEHESAAKLAELSPEALQYRTFEVVKEWLQQLAAEGPVVVALEDVHWADSTSLQLAERLLSLAEEAAVLLLLTMRPDPDHASWSIKELAARQVPHRTREVALAALSGDAESELLRSLVGPDTLPPKLHAQILAQAEGNPFFLEELVRSLVDSGAVERVAGGWRFDHETGVEVPATVEKVILARVDRLSPDCRRVLTAASVLGRQFSLPLLRGVTHDTADLRDSLRELQRLDLLREGRRWPQPEFRFKHVLIQETVYRTVVGSERRALHREAAEWLEQRRDEGGHEVLGLLAHHWLATEDLDKAIGYLTRAGDKARQDYALDEAIEHYEQLVPLLERRGESQAVALVLFKLALALHTSLRFAEANVAYQRAFDRWQPPVPVAATETLRIGTSFLPNDPDPRSAIAWPNIQLGMQLFDRLVEAGPERTIVPSLAERWEISEDGLRYVFHLREGLAWSDRRPLTAHDVEFGIKRVLDPDEPGSSVAIYFVLEGGQDYYLRLTSDADSIGVKARDDRTLEFRLVAPAPYFMSMMNRPDGGPQPRHAIEQHGEAWAEPERQVVSGPFRIAERTDDRLTLVRRSEYGNVARTGNVERVELVGTSLPDALELYERDELDMITVRYTPRLADQVRAESRDDAVFGPAAWTAYLAFDHSHPGAANADFRRALAHALDRSALAEKMPANLLVATGGLVPPALQGHTPDIVPRYEPELARELLARSGVTGVVQLAGLDEWADIVESIAESWRSTLGVEVETPTWSPDQAWRLARPWEQFIAPIVITGWLPGYSDPEYYLRLLLHSASKTNEGGYAYPPFDELIERARQERSDRSRLELFHEADRMAVADQVALIPLAYGRSAAFVRPAVQGWWEFGKASASFADLTIA